MKPFLTIFTPTYNRAYILSKAWESLCSQTNHNFIWLIVDDGSSDNTRQLIAHWKKESPFTIEYVFQNNSGKHIARDRAIDLCITPLFMTLDSDDYLIPEAVELIYGYYEEDIAIGSTRNIIGWLPRKGNFTGGC